MVFDACQLASKIKDGKVEHLTEANKVIQRIKSEQVDLKIHNLGSGQLSLLVYTDASLGNLPQPTRKERLFRLIQQEFSMDRSLHITIWTLEQKYQQRC